MDLGLCLHLINLSLYLYSPLDFSLVLCLDLFLEVVCLFVFQSTCTRYRMQSESKTVNLKAAAAASLETNHCIIGLFGFLLHLCWVFGLFVSFFLYMKYS